MFCKLTLSAAAARTRRVDGGRVGAFPSQRQKKIKRDKRGLDYAFKFTPQDREKGESVGAAMGLNWQSFFSMANLLSRH
jgi:hypothetical protein